MISKKDILKMAKRVMRRSQGHGEAQLTNPYREWFIGVGLFLVITLVGGVYNARSYVYYDSLDNTIEQNPVTLETYEAEDVTETITTYSEREALFIERTNNIAAFVPESATSTATTTSANESSANEELTEVEAATSSAPSDRE